MLQQTPSGWVGIIHANVCINERFVYKKYFTMRRKKCKVLLFSFNCGTAGPYMIKCLFGKLLFFPILV
jgi:hypothetical protein